LFIKTQHQIAMKTKKAQIDNFLAQKQIAVAGYSRNPKKFGSMVYKALKEHGYQLYPVNPAGGNTPEGDPIYETLDALPADVKALYLVTKPEVTATLVDQALEKSFSHIWIQQMSDNEQIKEKLKDFPEKVTGQCMFMHLSPTGIHKFHWWLAKVFGTLPK
jgi:uncharacterized protein